MKFRTLSGVRPLVAMSIGWLILCVASSASAQPNAPAVNSVAITQSTSLTSVRNLPPQAMVRLPSGREISAQRFNAQVDMLRRAQQRSAPRGRVDLSIRPSGATPALKITDAASLSAALSRSNSDTVELPNGARLTVGDLRKLGALAQRERGRNPLDNAVPVSAAARASSAPPILVRSKQDLMALKGRPDNTVVQAPNGARITLGDIRAAARAKRTR